MKTNYSLEYTQGNIKVIQDGKQVAHGFTSEERALEAVFALEGKKVNDFYVVDSSGRVERIARDTL